MSIAVLEPNIIIVGAQPEPSATLKPKLLPSASEVSIDGKLRVLEIYPAFQGEGTLTGQPSLFVRFAGCTVGCKWCDTKFSWRASQGQLYGPQELSDYIESCGYSHIVITGGEPFEQPEKEFAEFLMWLDKSAVMHVTFETSGYFHVPHKVYDMLKPILLSVSPKMAGAQTNYREDFLAEYVSACHRSDCVSTQVKFVIADDSDLTQALDAMLELSDKMPFTFAKTIFILQPCTPPNPNVTIAQICDLVGLQMQWLHRELQARRWHELFTNLRVMPQQHAMVYGHKRGV